ncbi:hypothetical protein H4F20_20040 [Vibrio sp. 16]|uniref:hypothetical protein n=1 Tax=Vibrio sp. 16 TaxID=391586 RepID=UPI002FF39921
MKKSIEEKTVDLLGSFIKHYESNDFYREHEKNYSEISKLVSEKARKLSAPLNVQSVKLYNIAENVAFCVGLYEYKFYMLAKSIVSAINERNTLSLANNTRSLLEQLASITYLISEIEKMRESLKDQGTLDKINNIFDKANQTINRIYLGEGKAQPDETNYKAIHINESLECLGNHIEDVEDLYSLLCEYVHPNYGNNKLVSSGTLGKGRFEARAINSNAIGDILSCSLVVFEHLDKNKIYNLSCALKIYNLVELFFAKGAKITNVFVHNFSTPSGDGKTSHTAYFFKKAKTTPQSIELFHSFLESKGIIKYGQTLGDMSDGYVYDIYHTSEGDIWLKSTMNIGVISNF